LTADLKPKTTMSTTDPVIFEGRRVSLFQDGSRGWRIRSRSAHLKIDMILGHGPESWARKRAREVLESGEHKKATVSKGTLKELVAAYEAMPKRAGKAASKIAVYRLTSCVRLVLARELDSVKVSEINAAFWMAYIAKRQGLEVADIATRRVENTAINAAMRCAASIFIPRLRPAFAGAGIIIAPDATVIQWLPTIRGDKPEVVDMETAWRAMERGPLWLALGLARFAGLRRDEVEHATAAWIQVDGAAVYVVLQDRPNEGWLSKTGRKYRALVIDPDLAATLRACPPGYIVQPAAVDRSKWFAQIPQRWMRQFTTARQPLHRLRGLYADAVASLTSDAITARLAGVKAASEALGHTSTKTTENHYLTAQ
jgi:integrase